MSGTFSQIQALSEERQQLWREAGKHKLKEMQCERIRCIHRELERLWHVYRCELVRPHRRFIEDRVRGDTFADFVDRLHPGREVVGHDPMNALTGTLMLEDEWDDMGIEMINVPENQRKGARLPVYKADEPVTVDFMLSVLRDVVAELKHEDDERASA